MSLPDPLQQHSTYNNYPGKREEHNDSSGSPEPDRNGTDKKQAKHRRNYQACEPCRERKVKCDLGDVDNPNRGPCKKCSRESKECYFNDTRKKGAGHDAVRPVKRARTGSEQSARTLPTLTNSPQSGSGFAYNPHPISPPRSFPGSSPGGPMMIQPNIGSLTSQPRSITVGQFSRSNNVFPTIQSGTGHSSNTNGPLMRTGDGDGHVVMPQANSLAESFTNTTDNMRVLAQAAATTEASASSTQQHKRSRTLTGLGAEASDQLLSLQEQKARKEGLKTWGLMRNVLAGWFSREEALDYMAYFYTYLAPMTPVIFQDFKDPSTHRRLLEEEPVLALAILALTSRYCSLKTDSRECRKSAIHAQLWKALTEMVQRLLWGQEQFGGGFCGAGMAPLSKTVTGQITWRGSLRTLGTIEALLLLTDWQPRAMHFPPFDHDDKLVHSNFEEDDSRAPQTSDSANLPYASWLEPAWRSDRMSWMLLGLAQSLSFELGVFDTQHRLCGHQHGPDSDCARRGRLRRMVITYVSQISGRIGIQSSLHPSQDVDKRGPELSTPMDRMQKLWFDIASIMFDANTDIFPSRETTAELVESGQYRKAIKDFQPRLGSWMATFEKIKHELTATMRHVLRMEYEYSRLYINSLGLQRVVGQMALQNRDTVSRGPSTHLIAVHDQNRAYIEEVRDAATQILKEACDGLGGLGALYHSPVRTFLRTLSGMMFSLKLLSLGCEESTVRKTFKLLKEMTRKMSDQVVDDLHLSPHTAHLITQLMEDVHGSMIRIPKPGSRGQSRQMSPQPNQTGPAMSYSALSDQESPDPLAQIPMVDVNNQSFMPPPNFDNAGAFDTNLNFDNMDPAMFGSGEDWISLPIDNLFGLEGTQVNQGYGGIGPTFGDRDMLSLLTSTQWDQSQNGMPQTFPAWNSGY